MRRMRHGAVGLLAVVMGAAAVASPAQSRAIATQTHVASIGHGVRLHYVEEGAGAPVVFVHGSLSDLDYWDEQIGPFAKKYRVIAYSRRYNWPNVNPAQRGYSAVVDAEDLAGLIRALHLGRVLVIGHSYGALAALFLAVRHPQMVRALVLAEPPAVSLLQDVPAGEGARGKAMYEDIQRRMVRPMQEAFRRGDRDQGIRIFMAYVFSDPTAWDRMSQQSRQETLKDAHEWEVMMRAGTLFPVITPTQVRSIRLPVLLLMGAKSYPFLGVIGRELGRLLPDSRTVVFQDAGHQMWLQDPVACREDVEKFLASVGIR